MTKSEKEVAEFLKKFDVKCVMKNLFLFGMKTKDQNYRYLISF